MSRDAIETDVLIVGAGPVGLLLASECARRGLRWRLVEASGSQSEHSKALAIFPRTLEILDMAGLVMPFLETANRVTRVVISTPEQQLALMPFAPAESPYPFIAMVPQDVTEKLLVQQLARRGGAVEYRTSFVSAIQHSEHVSTTLERLGERFDLDAKFVIGCDGAHSAVRHLLNLPFEGGDYADEFLLADVETNEALPADLLQLCPSTSGPLAIFPISATRRRIVATIDHPEDGTPSLELVRRLLRERAPSGIEARALHWSSFFRIHHRYARRLRVGRIFIAGDAAHIHSPFGGQGMNTGMHDVWNLAWKLDLHLRGHGNEFLLDSYEAERLPVIRNVIKTTDRLTKVMSTPNRLIQTLRDAVIPMVSRLAPFQHAFVQRLSELGVAYRDSPIVEGAGERYFDDSIRDGGIRSRFLLVAGGADDPAIEVAIRKLADRFADTVELRRSTAPRPRMTLVRPDGYIAYETDDADVPAALQSVAALLARQIRTPAVRAMADPH